ncbi:hypothetical protein [Streptomyces bambusae]|uniref:Uncharacterized protein n=1 Tax=Streptomyces bambusae TaxID=1550616 RepID=A0ABS6Z2U7_9ACTN|nr:hypothetical protein [Streptomyces bambusae]MBW5481040.1 hypothetical protein [Streptomyces bambusae]
MAPRFVGMDPNTQGGGSPTVWVDSEKHELVIQGWKADEALTAEISSTAWVEGHDTGIPDHETLIRIPARMVPILRKACDDAERAGLC